MGLFNKLFKFSSQKDSITLKKDGDLIKRDKVVTVLENQIFIPATHTIKSTAQEKREARKQNNKRKFNH